MQVSEAQTALHSLTCTQPCSSKPEHLPLHPTTGRSRHRALEGETQESTAGPQPSAATLPVPLATPQASVSIQFQASIPTGGSCDIMASAHSPEQGQSQPFSR